MSSLILNESSPMPYRFSTRSLRFMDPYKKGLTGSQEAWASRRYSGHRILPESILEELEYAKIA